MNVLCLVRWCYREPLESTTAKTPIVTPGSGRNGVCIIISLLTPLNRHNIHLYTADHLILNKVILFTQILVPTLVPYGLYFSLSSNYTWQCVKNINTNSASLNITKLNQLLHAQRREQESGMPNDLKPGHLKTTNQHI